MQKKLLSRLFLFITSITLILTPPTALAIPEFGSDFVFAPKSFGRPHGASLVELRGGDLMVTWFSAKEETDSEAEIYSSIRSRKQNVWFPPRLAVPDDYSKSVGNTALFRDDAGVIWLFFASVKVGGWSGAMVDYTRSLDNGINWEQGRNLVGWPGNLPRNPPIRLGPDEMLLPLFVDFWYEAGLTGSYVAIIKHKDSWPEDVEYSSLDDKDAIQPAAVKLPDGRILLLMRDKTDKFIRRAWSADNGKTWTKVEMTSLPNPGAGICAIYVEGAKAVLVAYNHSNKGRNPLSLAVSTNGGRSFRKIADLESRPGDKEASFDYPAMIQTEDGYIHIVWTHDNRATLKHSWFNVEWLMEKMEQAR